MITVLAAVMCGVTFSVSAAILNDTVGGTPTAACVGIGISTPCVISAATLLSVDTFGVDRSRRLPLASAALSATSRLKAPLIEPSASPTALEGLAAPRFTAPGAAVL